MAGRYIAWRSSRFHGGWAGLEIITLVSWNSPLESAAKVKGRPEQSLQAGFGGEAALQEGS